jgi:hypothetical protein
VRVVDRSLRRIRGFPAFRKLPSESTFSRAFDEFARMELAVRADKGGFRTVFRPLQGQSAREYQRQ